MAAAILRKTDSIDDARTAMLDVIAGVAKGTAPARKKWTGPRRALLKQIDLQLRDSEQVGLFLSEYLAQGDWRLLYLERDRIKAVTPGRREARGSGVSEIVKPHHWRIHSRTRKPDRAEIPAKTDVAAELKDYKGEAAIAQGEAFDASPKNIESRTERFTLASGAKVALLSKKTRGGSVHAAISIHFGTVDSPEEQRCDWIFNSQHADARNDRHEPAANSG